MLEDLFRRPSALARFRLPPLGPELDGGPDRVRDKVARLFARGNTEFQLTRGVLGLSM